MVCVCGHKKMCGVFGLRFRFSGRATSCQRFGTRTRVSTSTKYYIATVLVRTDD